MLSQVLVVIAMPVLTRMYSPSAFGELALFSSLYAILVAISTLKFDQAILLPIDRQPAELLTLLAVAISAFLSGHLLIGIALVDILGFASIPWFYFLLPIALVIGAFLSVGQQWCSREKAFSYIGTGMVLSTLVNVSLSFLFYWTRLLGGGLVLSFVLANFSAALYICVQKSAVFLDLASAFKNIKADTLKTLFWENRDLPLYVLPNVVLTSLAYQVLPILIAHFFDSATTGLYSVANRLMILPSILVGNVVLEVFKSEFVTKLHARAGYLQFFDKTLLWLIALAIPTYGLIWLLSPMLFHIMFGQNFLLAGEFARYLCLGVAGTFFVQSFAYVYIALGRTKVSTILQIASSVGQLVGFLIGAIQGSIHLALLYMSFITFAASVIFVYFAHHLTKVRANSSTGP